jgi:hypothetical protein
VSGNTYRSAVCGADVFKVLEEVGDSLALVLGEHILVQGIAGFAYSKPTC